MKKAFQLALIIILASCGTSTKITGSWSYDDEPVKLKNIAVIGISSNVEHRKFIEEDFAEQLLANGINAMGANEFLPPNASKESITKEILFGFLDSNGFDGVISISLLRKEDDRRYVSGAFYYAPVADVPLTDYYGQMTNYIYSPGYYAGSETFFLECNLFSYPEGKMLWSAQTKTTPYGSLQETSDDYARVVVSDLVESGILK